MRQAPQPDDGPFEHGPIEDAYAGLILAGPVGSESRAAVSLGMVTSVDGATAVAGRSANLGGRADEVAFGRLRSACDAIVVGAGTVRAEGYRRPTGDPARRAARVALGLAAVPALVVVTDRADLDPTSAVFADGDAYAAPVVVVTHGGVPASRVTGLREVVEVLVLGEDRVDLAALARWCHRAGWDRLLCEGGPHLAGSFAAADLIDEVFVTTAPVLVGGEAARVLSGSPLDPPRSLELLELRAHAGELLARYRVRR